MKVKFTKLAALLLSGAALLAAGCTDYEVDIQKNADAIASANDQIKALQSTIATLETAADHKADVDKLNKAISDLETALNGKIAELTTEVGKKLDKTEFETAKKQLTDALDALSKRVKDIEDANFQAQIDALSDKVDKCATKEELQKAVTDLTTYVDGEIAKLNEKVEANAKAIKKINEETIPAINEQIKAIKEKNEAQDNTLTVLSNAVKDLVALTAGFPEDTTIKEYVDNMEATLKQYVQDELKKYVTLSEFNSVKAQLEGRLNGLDKMLKGFGAEEGSVKTYIDNEILRVNNAIKALEEAHAKDIEALNKAIEQVKADILAVKAAIRSLVFVPEVYVDGVEAILVSTLHYSPLELKDTNTVNENAVPKDTVLNVTPPSIAKYHVIPSNADLDFLHVGDTVKFVVRENDPFIVTRANATDDFKVVGIYQGRDTVETDCINVRVDVTGLPATDKNISVVALQLTKDDETYTSDYATVFSEDINDVRIADPTNVEDDDAHYRRATEVISGTDAEAFLNVPVWTDTFDTLSVDHQMAYDEAFNVKEYVIAHFIQGQECRPNEKTFEGLGFTWKFELVEDYDFCDYDLTNLTDEGVLTVKDGNAINTTPIVRVTIKDGDNNVQIAYVKVWVAPTGKKFEITWSKKVGANIDVDDQFEFKCEGDTLFADSTVLARKIWNEFPITKANYDSAYKFVGPVDTALADSLGTVSYDVEKGVMSWEMTAEQLWAIAADPNHTTDDPIVVTWDVYFEAINGARVVVTLTADVKPVAAYNIPVKRYIQNYWNEKLTAAQYNVATPDLGETDSTKCVFHNNINAAFLTDSTGVIDLGERKLMDGTVLPAVGEPGLEVSNINYFFCPDIEKVTKVGKYDVKFEVKNDSTELWAAIDGEESVLIATIDNASTEKALTPNIVILNKVSEDPNHAAKRLLNTDELFIYIGATGLVCGDAGFEVNLYWPDAEGKYLDHFQADYIQPVKVTDTANDYFVDAVDFGQDGSFITLKDLVAPKDWRGRVFGMNEGDQYYNYWDYYGIFKISVNVDKITCDLTPDGKVPVTLDLKPMSKDTLLTKVNVVEPLRDADGNIVKDDDGNVVTVGDYINGIDDGGFGFLTYRNNGTFVKKFNLSVPVTVQYGWGIISTEKPITVPVATTIKEGI